MCLGFVLCFGFRAFGGVVDVGLWLILFCWVVVICLSGDVLFAGLAVLFCWVWWVGFLGDMVGLCSLVLWFWWFGWVVVFWVGWGWVLARGGVGCIVFGGCWMFGSGRLGGG